MLFRSDADLYVVELLRVVCPEKRAQGQISWRQAEMPLSSGGSRYLCRGLALGRAYGVNLSELRFLSAIYTDEELDAPLFYRHYRC